MTKNNFSQINFYCDESCYVQGDKNGTMVLASVFCDKKRVETIKNKLKEIKQKYGFPIDFELKWTKVGYLTINMYKEIVNYIANLEPRFLKVRIIVANDKSNLDFKKYNYLNYHDWFYRMYYYLLVNPISIIAEEYSPFYNYKLFIDKKDTHTGENIGHLCDIIERSIIFAGNINYGVYDSKEVQLIQLADLFAGATSYKNRKLTSSKYKMELVEYIEKQFKTKLDSSSRKNNLNFNVFVWKSGAVDYVK